MSNAANHYQSNLRDLLFNLFEFAEIDKNVLGKPPFTILDGGAARHAITQFQKLATTDLSASFVAGDRMPLRHDATGSVLLPEPLKRSIRAYLDHDWHLMEMPEHMGGMSAPPSLTWATFEMLAGANPTVGFYLTTMFMLRVIDRLGTPDQKQRFAQTGAERRWNCTMVLTEPEAGSDVGAGRTKATFAGGAGGDEWHIEGTKRFITNGDADAFENIIHLVLARPEGAAAGTKGLSLFLVPKIWVNPDGTLGERNGVRVTKVEHKMGLKGSATCELSFGDERPARGLLLGNVHSGIAQMFHVIEQARMAIGVKSMSALSTAYKNALAYAQERVQGPDLLRAMDKSSPRVKIIEHPDVRRMLMTQKSHAEGMRALCFYAASLQDQIEILGGHGAAPAADLERLNDLMLPLVKGYCSEKTYELLAMSLQCFGGSGYCQDYPIEQYIRDQKIDSLYEGTTHIQALDLLMRKIARDGGQTLRGLLGRVQKTLKEGEGGEALATPRAQLKEALGHVEATLLALANKMGESLYHVGLQGNRVLMALAELCIGWLLVRHAALALTRLSEPTLLPDEERAYYAGKVASARFFCANVLPQLAVSRRLVEESTLDLMNLDEVAF